MSSEKVARAVREALPRETVVLSRFGYFSPATLDRLIATGTDRDGTSSTFTTADGRYCVKNDCDPKVRAQLGITPERVTYCHRLDLREDPLTIRWGGHEYEACSEKLARMLTPTSIVMLYSAAMLTRAPGAEVEYWFAGDPREALLHVITPTFQGMAAAMGQSFAAHTFNSGSAA